MAWPFVDAKNVAAVHPASPGDDTHCLMFRSGGDVAPGYESVRERFICEFLPGGQEDRAQLCVYVRGVKVVDVWASRVVNASCSWGRQPNEQEYGPSSLQNIFSSTKVRFAWQVVLEYRAAQRRPASELARPVTFVAVWLARHTSLAHCPPPVLNSSPLDVL